MSYSLASVCVFCFSLVACVRVFICKHAYIDLPIPISHIHPFESLAQTQKLILQRFSVLLCLVFWLWPKKNIFLFLHWLIFHYKARRNIRGTEVGGRVINWVNSRKTLTLVARLPPSRAQLSSPSLGPMGCDIFKRQPCRMQTIISPGFHPTTSSVFCRFARCYRHKTTRKSGTDL